MATSDMFDITLKLGGYNFQITIPRSEEIYYRNAEKRINQRHSFYVNNYPTVGNPVQYLLMTILDVTVELEKSETNGNVTPLMNTLNGLIKNMDDALK